jgi:hypothetical protein
MEEAGMDEEHKIEQIAAMLREMSPEAVEVIYRDVSEFYQIELGSVANKKRGGEGNG